MDRHSITVRETVDARKKSYSENHLATLFRGATRIVASRGKKSVSFNLRARDLDRKALTKAVLGPSGNLRAPAARIGKVWLVGFNDESWSTDLGT